MDVVRLFWCIQHNFAERCGFHCMNVPITTNLPNLDECERTNSLKTNSLTTSSSASLTNEEMNCISSGSIHACAQLRNVCSRSHVISSRPFARFSLARAYSLRDRAPARRAYLCATYHTSPVRNSYKDLSASRLSQRSSCDRNMSSSNATATTAEKVTTADNNPLLEVSCHRRCFLRAVAIMLPMCTSSKADHISHWHVCVWVCRTPSLHNSTRSRQSMLCLVLRHCLQSSTPPWMN